MLHADRYFDGHAAPGAGSFDIRQGERSIAEQYVKAIDAAHRSIYLENQAIPIMEIAAPLAWALARGVDVVLLVPTTQKPMSSLRAKTRKSGAASRAWSSSRAFQIFCAGLAGRDAADSEPLYVHAKLMIVDDAWCTICSCNLHEFSLVGHCEMNASIWDGDVARRLRRALLSRHIGVGTNALDDLATLRLLREVSDGNRRRQKGGEPVARGHALSAA